MSRRSVDRTALIAFVVAVLVLGGNPVGVRFSNRELAPFFGAALRFAISAAVLFAIVALRGIALPRGRALVGAGLYGFGQFFLNFALLYWALVEVSAGTFSVVFATLPLWTILLSSAVGFERLTARNVIGTLVAVAGLAVVFASEISGNVPLVRVGAILAGALSAAGTGVLVKAFPRTDPVATNAVGTLVGAPLLLVLAAVAGERLALPHETATWLAIAFLVLSTVVGFVTVTFVILRWTPSAAAYQVTISPIVTVVLATLLAGEAFGPGFFVGGAIVLLGVVIGAAAAGRPRSAEGGIAAAD